LNAAPLLEEKPDFRPQALIPNIGNPLLHDGSRTQTWLAAHNGVAASLEKEKFFWPEDDVMALEVAMPQTLFSRLPAKWESHSRQYPIQFHH
jgi:hypothetical protein